MTATMNDAISTPGLRVLAALRALAADSFGSNANMFCTADHQARVLRNLLPFQANRIPTHLARLIPSVCVDYIDNLPVSGTAFWGNGHWSIHVRAGDPVNVQVFIMLHELKHIIDHPIRQQSNAFGGADWEALADYFAGRVLAHGVRSCHGGVIQRDNVTKNISIDLHDSLSQSKEKTGGVR